MDRYLLTHSLMYSWLYAIKENPFEDMASEREPMKEFISTLKREQTPTSAAMQDGINFEDLTTAIMEGKKAITFPEINHKTGEVKMFSGEPCQHKWYEAASQVVKIVGGSVLQYRVSKTIEVGGLTLLLYGRLDCLKSGEIYDIKFSRGYDRGKYIGSTQHPTYLELVPEAAGFTYVISNGTDVWTERYRRDETPSIIPTIENFVEWLQTMNLLDTYKKYWLAK